MVSSEILKILINFIRIYSNNILTLTLLAFQPQSNSPQASNSLKRPSTKESTNGRPKKPKRTPRHSTDEGRLKLTYWARTPILLCS